MTYREVIPYNILIMKTQSKFVPIELQLLNEISEFCESTGLSERQLLVRAVNDPKVLKRVRQGRQIQSGTINGIREYIFKNKA